MPCSICGRKFAEDRVAKHKVGPDDGGDDENRCDDDEPGQLVVVMVMISTMLTYEAELYNDVDDGEVMMRMTIMVRVMMQRTKLRHTRRDNQSSSSKSQPTTGSKGFLRLTMIILASGDLRKDLSKGREAF